MIIFVWHITGRGEAGKPSACSLCGNEDQVGLKIHTCSSSVDKGLCSLWLILLSLWRFWGSSPTRAYHIVSSIAWILLSHFTGSLKCHHFVLTFNLLKRKYLLKFQLLELLLFTLCFHLIFTYVEL